MRNRIVTEDLKYIASHDLPWDKFRGRTILVTGASGFLPSYIVETLLFLNETRQMDIHVLALVRNQEQAEGKFHHHRRNSSLKFLVQDVCDKIHIEEKIDFIIHAASQASPSKFRNDPVGTISPNVIGTANLLALATVKKLAGFLFFSSSGVYGNVDESRYPINENCFGSLNPTDLASSYLESKRMGENICVAWMHQFGIPIRIVRPAITYGPGIRLDDGRSFADFVCNILNKNDLTLFSDGTASRNFCYIADATLGFFIVMLKGSDGEAYNVASDQEIRIVDLANTLATDVFPELGLKVVVKKDTSKNFLRMNFPRTSFDVSKLDALGWKRRFSIKDGFTRTVESFSTTGSNSASL